MSSATVPATALRPAFRPENDIRSTIRYTGNSKLMLTAVRQPSEEDEAGLKRISSRLLS